MTLIFLLATLVLKVVDFLRLLTDFRNQRSGVLTQLCAWVGGIVVVFLYCNASLTKSLVFPGLNVAFADFNTSSKILAGLLIASLASALVDGKQALDRSDSAAKPPLLS